MQSEKKLKPKQCTTPGCNRNVVPKTNSTIIPKLCPYHEYKKHYQKSNLKGQNSNKKQPMTFGKGKGKKSKKNPKTIAMERADKWFSRYIRLKYSTFMVSIQSCYCYTCHQIYSIKNIDCGHFHNRENMAVRYHEDNARPQCKHCNRYKSGKHTKFRSRLVNEIGSGRLENLNKLALSGEKYNIQFFEEMADKYRRKYRELSDKLGVDPWKSN